MVLSQAANKAGLPVQAVEKDLWVTVVLQLVFTLPVANHLVFGDCGPTIGVHVTRSQSSCIRPTNLPLLKGNKSYIRNKILKSFVV